MAAPNITERLRSVCGARFMISIFKFSLRVENSTSRLFFFCIFVLTKGAQNFLFSFWVIFYFYSFSLEMRKMFALFLAHCQFILFLSNEGMTAVIAS